MQMASPASVILRLIFEKGFVLSVQSLSMIILHSAKAEIGTPLISNHLSKKKVCTLATIHFSLMCLSFAKQSSLHIVAGVEFEKDRRTQKSMLRAVGQIEIRVGLMDAHCQLKSEELLNGISQVEEIGTEKGIFPKNQQSYPKYLLLLGMKRNWEPWYEGYVPGLLSIQDTFSVYQAAGKADAMLLLPRRHCVCRRHPKKNSARRNILLQ
ncbi:hypothetical protein KIW84_014003 [Lathyrus oleraceus]|uniref:Uncharacterized protein n=1 Tax=Pisum sativum TaxID=3888 RepID=A0A9D5BLJ1_PEA|nr:hypothetical protein KIW84_014003 [Pisum sativum]